MKRDFLLNIDKENPGHAYIILGDQAKRKAWIESFVDFLEVDFADLFFLESLDKIKIQDIRNLQHQISLKPHSSRYKIAVIENANTMTLEASNAILKTLEEPSQNSIIVISTKSEEDLLATVTSRARKIKVFSNSTEPVNKEDKELISSISKMSVKEKFDLAKKISSNNESENFINKLIIILREKMLGKEISVELVEKIQNYRKIFNSNANKRFILENIFLEI
jgi:DNA polymerase-3 subunit delta'